MRRRLLKKLRQLGPRGAVEHHSRHTDRDLVPGRSQGRPKGNPRLYLGADRLTATDGARQPPYLRLPIRRDLPGARRRRRDDRAARQYRGDEPAPAGNQHAGCPGGARRPDLRRGWLASAGQATEGADQSHPAFPAALQSRALGQCPKPMENVWDYLRQNKLCARVWDTYDDIVDACKQAWNFLIDDPERIRSIGSREWTCVTL